MTNRKLKIKELSSNAIIIKDKLKKYDTKILTAQNLHSMIMKDLNCSLRTSQRVIKELVKAKKLSQPVTFRVTLKY